ncbi:MAG TPA: LysM domain-containing protein [Candidatus Angelobacter sp.]|jgi:hypothetical protein|nr:LysM domain-containing protein [Candidatus Angelobacter sp.]
MFFPGSRYEKTGTYKVTQLNGTEAVVVKLPLPLRDPLLGFHPRTEGQRLDLIAARYLADATTFWRLCDANGTLSPDALAARDLVGIPDKGR